MNLVIWGAYKRFMNLVPDDDWVCFLDHDASFTTPDWYPQLEEIIETNPEYGAYTCMMNRVGQQYQIPQGINPNNHDMKYHRAVGKSLQEKYRTSISPLNNVGGRLLSGVLILISKKTWNSINGCPDGFLGVDNEIHRRCIVNNIPVGLINGVYLYHWYRAEGADHVHNAMKHHPNALGKQ